jgi:hypothetical protein
MTVPARYVVPAAIVVGVGLGWWWLRMRSSTVSNPSDASAPPFVGTLTSDTELDPDDDWMATYERQLDAALRSCCDDPSVNSFDQAVVALLERIFPQSGSFALAPDTGQWKRQARDRARQDLATRLGRTENDVRATLTSNYGRQMLQSGRDPSQAVRAMGMRAFPSSDWNGPYEPWQILFTRAAMARLTP